MQTKHTPGPWFSEGDGATLMVYAAPQGDHGAAIPIADCAFPDAPESIGDECEANAALIAAAPALLAASESAENWLTEYETGPDSGLHDLLAQLRSAIAKARVAP